MNKYEYGFDSFNRIGEDEVTMLFNSVSACANNAEKVSRSIDLTADALSSDSALNSARYYADGASSNGCIVRGLTAEVNTTIDTISELRNRIEELEKIVSAQEDMGRLKRKDLRTLKRVTIAVG